MSADKARKSEKRPSVLTNVVAGGGAGMMEALACHPLGISSRAAAIVD
jgi:hypothetical protein